MDVIARVAHAQAVLPAVMEMEHRLHTFHRERDVVDRPLVEAMIGGVALRERHLDHVVGC